MQRTKSKILSILLSLVMLLSLLPTTALATTYNDVKVNGVSLGDGEYLTSNAATAASISSTEPTTYVAWYKNGVLTLNNFTGKSNSGIVLQGAPAADLIIKLIGNNTITPYDTGIQGNSAAGSITITADSGSNGNLTINMPNSERSAFGINGSANSVTISGSADVTIIATATATNQESYGIKSSKAVSILDSASVSITCKTPNSTSRSDSCNGIYSDTGVTINTDGTIQIDVREAGDEAYSYGINSMGTLTLTKVGGMTVKWKKSVAGRGIPLSPSSASFDSDAYVTHVDETNCTATYTPKVAATITSVSATVSQPVKGHPLDTSVNVGGATAYTADVMWKADGVTVTGDAQADTVYTALITLKAKEGETFATTLNNTTTPGGYTIQMLNSTELLLTKEFDRTNLKETTGFAIDDTTLTVAVPTAEPNMEQTAELPLTAKVIYDDGTDETVDAFWSIVDPKPEGVDIDKTTGKLTVTNKAAGGTVKVKAALNGMTDEKTVTIKKDGPVESAIVATAPTEGTNITIPNGGTNTSGNCSYKVYDQYGAEMTGSHATWKMKLDPATVTGVNLIAANGSISVTSDATACKATLYAEGSGVKSNEITFNIARAASVPTSLTIEGSPDSVTVPTVTEPGTTKCAYGAYTAKVKDQYGEVMTGQTIEWSFTEKPGVTFNNGQLTVTNKADTGTVTITAKSGTLTATKTVTINKDTATVSIVKITAQDGEPPVTTIICTGSQRTESYTATVYDQYGVEKQDDVTWSLDPTPSGVTYEVSTANDNIVTLKVAPNADEGTFKLVATSSSVTTVKGELPITVQKKNNVSDKIKFDDGSLTYNGNGQEYKTAALDSSVTPGTGGAWTYTYAANGGTASLDGGLPKTVGTYTVTATYEDSLNIGSKTATLTITAKKVDIPDPDTTVYTYDGTAKTYNIPTSPYYTVSGNIQTNANKAGHIVTVTLKDSTNTIWANNSVDQKIFMFKIMKATPIGEPAHTEITTSGKKLSDAGLTTTGGTFSVSGTVKWVDDTTGADLLDTTTVEANKLYKWVFTPSDSTNYEPINGTIKLWNKSTSSGGYYYAPTAAVVPDMPMLYRGCTGDAVKTLQDKLNALGYNSGSVDGIFGAKTYAAVTAFQKANSLGVDGIVGKLTWGKIYGVSPAMPVETTTVVGRPMVSYGSRGDAVRKLQELLNALGYDCGSVDGIFGSKTKAAVLAFQKANGLGVDGIVGPLTWAKLG